MAAGDNGKVKNLLGHGLVEGFAMTVVMVLFLAFVAGWFWNIVILSWLLSLQCTSHTMTAWMGTQLAATMLGFFLALVAIKLRWHHMRIAAFLLYLLGVGVNIFATIWGWVLYFKNNLSGANCFTTGQKHFTLSVLIISLIISIALTLAFVIWWLNVPYYSAGAHPESETELAPPAAPTATKPLPSAPGAKPTAYKFSAQV